MDTLISTHQRTASLLSDMLTSVFGGDASKLPHAEPSFPEDWYVMAYMVLLCLAANWGLRLLFVEPFARLALLSTTGDNAFIHKRSAKMAQSVMEIIFYGSFFVVGLLILIDQPWLWPSSEWWSASGGAENQGNNLSMTMRSDFRAFYMLYGARYMQGFLSVLMEYKRKDFIEMQIHHSVTAVVIVLSLMYGYNRVGGVVMVLLDVGDVPLHFAKVCRYLAIDSKQVEVNGKYQTMADLWFVVFAVVFFVTRVVMYPYVWWSASFESAAVWANMPAVDHWYQYRGGHSTMGPGEWACVGLLTVLLVLQMFWFGLIIKAAYGILVNGKVEDSRSDSETEPDPKKND